MKAVYEAAHTTDAYLVKNLLEEAGIPAFVRGEHLQGGMGDLPLAGLVQVCVAPENVGEARAIITDWQQAPIPADSSTGEQEPQPPATPRSNRLLLGMAIGGALGALLTWAAMRGPTSERTLDYNGDGVADERTIYHGDELVRVEIDRNFDGKVDQAYDYNHAGTPTGSKDDDDFDGRMETMFRFVHGQMQSSETDHDGDGAADYRSDAINGVIYREEWLDPHQNIVKRITYKNGRADNGEIDSDGDGKLDSRRFYNRIAEVVRVEPMKP